MRRHRLSSGLLVAGSTIRLFASEGTTRLPERYLEFRLDRLESSERPYLGILAPGTLSGEPELQRLLVDARRYGAELKDGVEEQIRDAALPALVRGLLPFAEGDPADPAVRQGVSDAALTLLFRLVFLLYAESADYLPVRSSRYEAHSIQRLAADAREAEKMGFDATATGLWDASRTLVNAIRTGNTTWGVPAYNGALFAPSGFPGAAFLARASLSDAELGPALVALAYGAGNDLDKGGPGIDWAGLGVAQIGSIYEGLLHLRLAYAEHDLGYDKSHDRYQLAKSDDEVAQPAGSCFLLSESGGRKSGGVFYTQELFVDHLVAGAIGPPLGDHLQSVREIAARNPEAASETLLDFAVVDPAMGSGHFLVGALDFLAAEIGAFLREVPLKGISERLDALRRSAVVGDAPEPTDRQLLRRLLVKHMVFGVDRSEMAVELARISLWLSSFVPGLPLSVLEANLKFGDSLIGVDRIERITERVGLLAPLIEQPLGEAVRRVAEAAEHEDLTLDEVEQTRTALEAATAAAAPAGRLLDAYTAIAFGATGASDFVDDDSRARSLISGDVQDATPSFVSIAELRQQLAFLHWPLAFPRVFARENPGFDAVVGNPPWNEITVERTGFFIQHDPGLGSVRQAEKREARIAALAERFPELERDYEEAVETTALLRSFFRSPSGDYELQGSGDLDLYELFCERYGALLRDGGGLGVVLPRSAFYIEGTVGFRHWLFRSASPRHIDTILNAGRWAFDMEPRYTIALTVSRRATPATDQVIALSGPHSNEAAFVERSPVPVAHGALRRWTRPHKARPSDPSSWEVPLLASPPARDLYDALMTLPRFDEGGAGDWRAFAATEFHVSNDRDYIRPQGDAEVWTGRTFEQFQPWFGDVAGYFDFDEGCERLERKRQGSDVWKRAWPEALGDPATLPARGYRVAFRDVTRASDTWTVRACTIPPQTFLTNKAPYLVLPEGGRPAGALLLGVMNSLVFNWMARRIVEISLNFFVLNMLRVPEIALDSTHAEAVITPAARLQAVHEDYREWAESLNVDCGPLSGEEADELRRGLEVAVFRAYGLGADELDVVLEDFTERAVTPEARAALRQGLS